MTPTCDVLVVGAGPAGCAAAYGLVRSGLRVILLDRKRFPRMKPCGGALTIKALDRLPYSIAPVIRRVAYDLTVSLKGASRRTFPSAVPICVMTQRDEFDDYCFGQTLDAGAEFELIPNIEGCRDLGEVAEVALTDGRTMTARYIVGADGARSRVRHLARGLGTLRRTFAVEGQVALSDCGPTPDMRFDFGYVPGGYGWVFHKGEHLNVGLYSQYERVRFGKNDLVEYASRFLGTTSVNHRIGYPIGVGGDRYEVASKRIFLAGDAAGLADPLLGEGIHNALKSGQAAATAILAAEEGGADAGARYARELREIQADLRASGSAAAWFYRLQTLGFGVLASMPARTSLMRGFAAGMTYNTSLH